MVIGLLNLLDGGRVFLGRRAMSLWMGGRPFGVNASAALKLREKLFAEYPFTPEAAAWLRQNTAVAVKDPARTAGGGYWYHSSRLVFLFTGQMEAALHEHAHAWWEFHGHRLPAADDLIDALIRLAAEPDPAYAAVRGLAHDYVHGIHTPDRDWPGMLVDRNDHEIFAGLASGTMGDMSKLPPYMRVFYRGLFKQ
jgi:hypothetical protein